MREAGRNVRGLGVFRLVKRCVCTFFFFFFLNFGLTRPFRPIQADTADTDRVGPILAASAPISAESAPTSAASARFGPCHVARRGKDARSAASLPRPRVPPRRTRVRWPWGRIRASQLEPNAYARSCYVIGSRDQYDDEKPWYI